MNTDIEKIPRTLSLRLSGRITKDTEPSKFIGTEKKSAFVTKATLAVNFPNRDSQFYQLEIFSEKEISLVEAQEFQLDSSEIQIYQRPIWVLDGKMLSLKKGDNIPQEAFKVTNENGYEVKETIITIKVNEKYCGEHYLRDKKSLAPVVPDEEKEAA